MACGEQENNEGFCGFLLQCSRCAMKSLDKGITLTFQGCVILDAGLGQGRGKVQ